MHPRALALIEALHAAAAPGSRAICAPKPAYALQYPERV